MKMQYNKSAIMRYAYFMKKHTRGMSFSDCLRSAWEAAKYTKAWTLHFANSYSSDFELVTGPHIEWTLKHPHQHIWDDMNRYGTN